MEPNKESDSTVLPLAPLSGIKNIFSVCGFFFFSLIFSFEMTGPTTRTVGDDFPHLFHGRNPISRS